MATPYISLDPDVVERKVQDLYRDLNFILRIPVNTNFTVEQLIERITNTIKITLQQHINEGNLAYNERTKKYKIIPRRQDALPKSTAM